MEYMSGQSLKDILEFVGNFNEGILQKIAYQILLSLDEYNENFNEDFNEFCSCDILFDKDGNLKVKLSINFFS